MDVEQCVFKLNGVVQHYSWGGYRFIPQLLGVENPHNRPFAEYWLGAHPLYPSVVQGAGTLAELIKQDPGGMLGSSVAKEFSSLPYLLKVLDVRQMLSIQVHPSKRSAEKGFEEEDIKGIPLQAPNRNYKDRNHKPELMVALSDFWLLHGFKNEDALRQTLDSVPEFNFLKRIFNEKGYKGLYEEVMLMPQEEVNRRLYPLIQRISLHYQMNEIRKSDPDYWAARATSHFSLGGNYDRGIFSIYFFNLLHLKKGEGVFQPEGMPHAYLEGQNVEVMANSDNVLRAGLTDKHIDVPELMKHVSFTATKPQVLSSAVSGHGVFRSPATEFELHAYALEPGAGETVSTHAGDIFLLLDGGVTIQCAGKDMTLQKGESVFVVPGTSVALQALSRAYLFRVTVPQ